MDFDLVLNIALSLIAVFLAIVLHEVAHGYVAYRLGDPTAKSQGRLTLNPLAHVDLIGTILVPATLILIQVLFSFGGFVFGWAKPVPINPGYFKNPRRGMLLVAASGPGTNLALALGTAVVGRLVFLLTPSGLLHRATGFAGNLVGALFLFLSAFVLYNLILAMFNILPIPPLDGSRILMYFLSSSARRALMSIERYGFFILVALLYLGVLDPVFQGMWRLWQALLGPEWRALLIG